MTNHTPLRQKYMFYGSQRVRAYPKFREIPEMASINHRGKYCCIRTVLSLTHSKIILISVKYLLCGGLRFGSGGGVARPFFFFLSRFLMSGFGQVYYTSSKKLRVFFKKKEAAVIIHYLHIVSRIHLYLIDRM